MDSDTSQATTSRDWSALAAELTSALYLTSAPLAITFSDAPLPGVLGIALLGFPLHPAGAPSVKRAEHLPRVTVPLLFLQGTRDDLADLALLRPIVESLQRGVLHIVEGADHSFHVLKRSGRTDADLNDDIPF